jgi:WD40 repeat protein
MYFIGARFSGVDIWDYRSPQYLTTLSSSCKYDPTMFSCSSDCCLLAICNQDAVTVTIWDISDILDCKQLNPLVMTPWALASIDGLCFMKYNNHLVVGFDNSIAVFDAHSGLMLQSMADVGYHGRDAIVRCIDSVNDKLITVSGDGIVQEWNSDLTVIRRHELGFRVERACVALSGNAVALRPPSKDHVVVVDLTGQKAQKTLDTDWHGVQSLQFSADGGRILVMARYMKEAFVYDVEKASVLFEFSSQSVACYSFDGAFIYGSNGDELFCLDAEVGSSVDCQFFRHPLPFGQYYWKLAVVSAADVILM